MNSFSLIHTGMADEKLVSPTGREGVVRLEQSFELQERLVIEGHSVQIAVLQPRLLQGIPGRVNRKPSVVTLPAESLLLRGGDDIAVDQERRRTIVIVSRDAENRPFHIPSSARHPALAGRAFRRSAV